MGTCDTHLPNVSQSRDLPDWLIQSCYQSASSCVTERLLWPGHVQNVFKNVLVKIILIIILSLNTLIPNYFYGLAIKGDSITP